MDTTIHVTYCPVCRDAVPTVEYFDHATVSYCAYLAKMAKAKEAKEAK